MFDTGALSAVLSGIQSQQTQPVAPAPAPAPTSPLANLKAILTGGADYGNVLQKIGYGMSNMSNAGGDPFLSFAQGFGGAQKYTTEEQRLAAERAAAAEKQKQEMSLALQRLTQDQSQFDAGQATSQSQFDQRMSQDEQQHADRMELERASSTRQDQIAADSRRKTDAELLRLRKREDLTTDQVMKIDGAAKQASQDIIDPAERKRAYDAEFKRLTDLAKSGRLSDGPGVSEADASSPYLVNDAGEKMVLSADGNSWVPEQR